MHIHESTARELTLRDKDAWIGVISHFEQAVVSGNGRVCYLDRETADFLLFGYEDGKNLFAMCEADPKRYLKIDSIWDGNPLCLVAQFVKSNWTDDEKAKQEAWHAFRFRHPGAWRMLLEKTETGMQAIKAYEEFRRRRVEEMLIGLLQRERLNPVLRF